MEEAIRHMDGLTYSLKANQPTSEHYYNDVRSFAQEVLATAEHQLGELAERYCLYAVAAVHPTRPKPELYLELLTLGTYWNVYGAQARRVPALVRWLLAKLGNVRCKGEVHKSASDWCKGVLLTLVTDNCGVNHLKLPLTMNGLDRCLDWLEAVGDFRYEVDRLRFWQAYLHTLPPPVLHAEVEKVCNFAMWFLARSQAALGAYTTGVEAFLAGKPRRWREDLLFCGRQPVEYHLNMVGAELLNGVLRHDFLDCNRYELIVPGCMRAKSEQGCLAVKGKFGWQCTGCTAQCRVHHITKVGEKASFNVCIASHESEVLAQGGARLLLDEKVGVVGVACVPNLIAGGWKLRAHGIPAQCVVLDCSGCKKHWHNTGHCTDINLHELARIMPNTNTDQRSIS